MEIISFRFDKNLTKFFIDFVYDLYKDDKNWIPPIRKEILKQFSPDFHFYNLPENDHKHFLIILDQRVVGRISAMVNKDLRNESGNQIGTVGFFECIDNYDVAKLLLDSALEWLHKNHNIQIVWGPMNFDIWHGYRFMTNGQDRGQFIGEPYNKKYYESFFKRYGFNTKQFWNSVEITGKNKIIKMISRGAARYEKLLIKGYQFKSINLNKYREEINNLYPALTGSFSKFLGYTSISPELFEGLFLPYRNILHPDLFTLAFDEKSNLAGFIISFLDASDAVRAMSGKNNFSSELKFLFHKRCINRIIVYLGGITPEEATKKIGLGRAIFYHHIRHVLNLGYNKIIVALMANGNVVRGLLNGNASEAQREYTLFEKN